MAVDNTFPSRSRETMERAPLEPLSLLALAAFVIPPFVVAFVGSQWTATGPDSWYQTIEKPAWTPPGWVFGLVWSTLYLLMGLAAWRIWLTKDRKYSEVIPLAVWVGQLGLNLAWTYAFFKQESPLSGIVVIVALWLAIAATIAVFLPKSRLAAALLVPYLAWVTFAAALNIEIWRLN